jgi:hypothetical protein
LSKQEETHGAIQKTRLGNITVDDEVFEHDVVIRLSGKVKKAQEEAFEAVLRRLVQSFARAGKGDISRKRGHY